MESLLINPNVNGNIGSCTSNPITVYKERTTWTVNTTTLVTNSCTGEITPYDSWQYTGTSFFCGLTLLLLCMFVVIIVGD